MERLFTPGSQTVGTGSATTRQAEAMASAPQPLMKLPIYYSDLMDRVPAEAEVDELVSFFVKKPTFFMLAMLNTFLSFYEHDREKFTEVQGFLFANLVDDELFESALSRGSRTSRWERGPCSTSSRC
jgi:hypothetical protein